MRDLGHCHDGVQIADSCYRLSEDVEGSLEWAAASAACVAWGGYLATLDDSSEAAMLASTLRPQGDASRWIGLSTEGDCGGEYHWANNAPLDMTVSFLQFVSSSTEAAEAETDAHCVSVSRIAHRHASPSRASRLNCIAFYNVFLVCSGGFQVHENSNKHVGKKIEDRSCAEKLPFVCEKNMPVRKAFQPRLTRIRCCVICLIRTGIKNMCSTISASFWPCSTVNDSLT